MGAPYDGEQESGMVYVYHGGPNGLGKTPAQVIKGSDYGLKSFGHAISGGLDLDANKYPGWDKIYFGFICF